MRLTIFNVQHSDFGIYKCVGKQKAMNARQLFGFWHHLILFYYFPLFSAKNPRGETESSIRLYCECLMMKQILVSDGWPELVALQLMNLLNVITFWSPHHQILSSSLSAPLRLKEMTNIFQLFFFSKRRNRRPRFHLQPRRSLRRRRQRKRLSIIFHQLDKQPCTRFTWLIKVRRRTTSLSRDFKL